MATRELRSSPRILPLYARAALPLVPFASRLPGVPGSGRDVPDDELRLDGVRADADRVAAYARVCGFALRDELPATYPHMLAFPLHLALMADGRFPFGAVGLVHLENRIVQHRAARIGEPLDLRVRASGLAAHPKGRTFAIVSEARAGGELVWEEVSTMLRRGGGEGDGAGRKRRTRTAEPPHGTPQWRLPADLGRRYGAVSGDRNPIHLHPLTARLLGFPGPIAHGMWTAARCLAALDGRLPDALAYEVAFRRPIPLPSTVTFGDDPGPAGSLRIAVRAAAGDTLHLDGTVSPGGQTPH